MSKEPINDLGRWMARNRYTDPAFAGELSKYTVKPVAARTVYKWRHGLSVPRRTTMAAIKAVTADEVNADSFVEKP